MPRTGCQDRRVPEADFGDPPNDASNRVVQGKPDVLRKQLGVEAEAEGILRQLVWWVLYQRGNLSEVGSIDVRDNQGL